jgi:hypothetical protein
MEGWRGGGVEGFAIISPDSFFPEYGISVVW